MAIRLATEDLSAETKADILVLMGCIARYSEPGLHFEDGGFAYFAAAISILPKHFEANLEILTLYREKPDGHNDIELAAKCLENIESTLDGRDEQDRASFLEYQKTLTAHGVSVEMIRNRRT